MPQTDNYNSHQSSFAAIDVGDIRVGLAIASKAAMLPRPFATLNNDAKIWDRLNEIFAENAVDTVVVGLPQNRDNKDTKQTQKTRNFVKKLEEKLRVTIEWQDEALSSARAKDELISRGKRFDKEDIDALAATLILEDYLKEEQSGAYR